MSSLSALIVAYGWMLFREDERDRVRLNGSAREVNCEVL